MFRNWFLMQLTNVVNVTPVDKDPYTIFTVVSPDSGDSTKIYSKDAFNVKLKRWEWFEFDIEIVLNGDKTYKNLHGIRPGVKPVSA